jgi:hypothetical protein
MKRLIVLAMSLVCVAAAATEFHAPIRSTLPRLYLKHVPLGIDKVEVATVMGPPAKTAEINGALVWQYDYAVTIHDHYSYVFTMKDDKLVNVEYIFGLRHYSALELQAPK